MAKTKKVEPVNKKVSLAEMTPSEIVELVKKMKADISRHDWEKASGKARNTRLGFIMRKKVARALSMLTMKKILKEKSI